MAGRFRRFVAEHPILWMLAAYTWGMGALLLLFRAATVLDVRCAALFAAHCIPGVLLMLLALKNCRR